jgi:hypothetical protein
VSIPIDRRTRFNVETRVIAPAQFFAEIFPELVERHGAWVARGMAKLHAPPLGIEVGQRSWTLVSAGDTIVAVAGLTDDAFVVTLTDQHFSEWVQQQRTFNALVVGRDMRCRNGDERDISVWDSLWMTLLEGWRVDDDDLQFLDRFGRPLDLGSPFTPDNDPADVAHFLREAGFLHLRGWVDPALMAVVSDDIDRAVPHYVQETASRGGLRRRTAPSRACGCRSSSIIPRQLRRFCAARTGICCDAPCLPTTIWCRLRSRGDASRP